MDFETPYPPARLSGHTDTYFGTRIADPYRWMEDLESPELQQWIAAENMLTQSYLAQIPARQKIHARLMELSDYERFSMPQREAGRLFYLRNTGLQNQAVLYWQQGDDGEPALLLDPNTLSADATVALGSFSVSEDGNLLAYALSEAGSDVQRIHIKRVDTGEDLPDQIAWVKFSGLAWSKDGRGFYYSSFGIPDQAAQDETLKRRTEFHKLYFHTLGTPQTEDQVIYDQPADGEMLVGGGLSDDGRWLILSAGKGHTNTLSLSDLVHPEREPVQLAPQADAIYSFLGNIGSTAWLQITADAPKGRIVRVDLDHPDRGNWQTVVPEQPQSLESVSMVQDQLLLTYVVDARSKVEQRTLTGELLREVTLPALGRVDIGGGRREDTEVFFAFTNYTTPGTIYRLDLASGASSVWRQPSLRFSPSDYETRLEFAQSKDGTRVPLFITFRKGTALDGSAPAILYGYGGFSVSLGPAYSSSRLAWMEMGGVYAEAILRGGGEYGEDWHQGGTRLNKQNVFDDFIACSEFLHAHRYTSPKKLAINGGSNGGLLVAAVELQRPELFGAAVPQVGVLDMLRFDKFTIGYAWKPDYGAPSENEAEFRALLRYSPLHNIRPGTAYPPTLITTADHDDRVFPAHSFKFAAALQAAAAQTPGAAPVLIRVETRAGHGAGMPLSKQLDGTADIYAFLVRALEMEAFKGL